jgi:two-component sensor histidine kinase
VSEQAEEIDLGVYLSQIATAVMASHAVEGIRLDLRVDAYPVSINVAMPTGLVVNELLTNSLKHAFRGRDGGTITLHSVVDGNGCRVTVADDGVGLPAGETWPKRGRLGALIAESLKQNAGAHLDVTSDPENGTSVTITYSRAAAVAP